jgi:plasmid stabilization system protein ParE
MPRIIYTQTALADLVRLRDFLKSKSPEASKRAVSVIQKAIEKTAVFPDRFRPVPELTHYREIIIDFGGSGYIARFRYKEGEDIYIVRIKHQLENDGSYDNNN